MTSAARARATVHVAIRLLPASSLPTPSAARRDEERRAVRALAAELIAAAGEVDGASVQIATARDAPPVVLSPGGRVSWSHCDRAVLVAWTGGTAAIGADIQDLRPVRNAERIARRVLTPDALAAWSALPPDARDDDLLTRICALEAVRKATGAADWRKAAAVRSHRVVPLHLRASGLVANLALPRAVRHIEVHPLG